LLKNTIRSKADHVVYIWLKNIKKLLLIKNYTPIKVLGSVHISIFWRLVKNCLINSMWFGLKEKNIPR